MNREEIHVAVLEYLDLIENGGKSKEENLKALERALDTLALASNFIDHQFDENDYPEAPRQDYGRLRQLAEKQFPDFGHYNMPETIIDRSHPVGIIVGDAIDDIVDISLNMHEIAWRWKHTSQEDALWYFQFGYRSDWGRHLRCLQLYILASTWGL